MTGVQTCALPISSAAPPDDEPAPFLLHVRMSLGHDVEAVLGGTLTTHLSARRLQSMNTAKQGLSIDVTYGVSLRREDSAESLVKTLNRIDGVQSVELVRQEPVAAG